jgi:hypothetical protein
MSDLETSARKLLDAAHEILCALDHPEAWNLDFNDAIALKYAAREVEQALAEEEG